MQTTITREPLRLRVNERRMLSTVLPATTTQAADALAEALQNASRARATRFDLHLDGRVLTLSDNGPGLIDPEHLFTVAESGWGEDAHGAADPAGIGAFSLFTMAERIEVVSRPREPGSAWRASFTEEAFNGAAIRIEDIEDDGTNGLLLRLELKAQVRLPKLTEPAWRHRYPVQVFVNVDGTSTEVPPVEHRADASVLETSVGPVRLSPTRARTSREESVVDWEHRLVQLPGEAFCARVTNAIRGDTLAHEIARHLVKRTDIEWQADPARAAARPRLPDRREMIDDAGLAEAMSEIGQTIVASIDTESVLSAAAKWIANRDIVPADATLEVEPEATGGLTTTLPARLVLRYLEFREAQATRNLGYVGLQIFQGIEGMEHDWDTATTNVLVRARYAAASPDVEMMALGDGIAAMAEPLDKSLPGLWLDADALLISKGLQAGFATGLHYVTSGGVKVGMATRVAGSFISEEVLVEPASFVARHANAIRSSDTDLGVVYPLPQELDVLTFVQSNQYAEIALRAEDWNDTFWDWIEGDEPEYTRLSRVHAQTLASELGPELQAKVAREVLAAELAESLRALNYRIGETIRPWMLHEGKYDYHDRFEIAERHGLSAEQLTPIRALIGQLRSMLDGISPASLLGESDTRSMTGTTGSNPE